MNGISPKKGLFVTNSKYSPRATEVGIATIDGAQLQALEQRYRGFNVRRWSGRVASVLAVGGIGYIVATGLKQKDMAKHSLEWEKWVSGRNAQRWTDHTKEKVNEAVRRGKKMVVSLLGNPPR